MDRDVIERKLEALRRCTQRVEDRRPPLLETLVADLDIQDVLVLNLSRAVQLCVDIAAHVLTQTSQIAPMSMGDTFSRLADAGAITPDLAKRLRAAVGFRNIAVHNYEVIDWAIVHAISSDSLHDFDQFARQVAMALPPG